MLPEYTQNTNMSLENISVAYILLKQECFDSFCSFPETYRRLIDVVTTLHKILLYNVTYSLNHSCV